VTISGSLLKKSAIVLLLGLIGAGAFATLGDGRTSNTRPTTRSILSSRTAAKPGSFSLRSGYTFRGTQVINTTPSTYTINLNTVATYQKGRVSYIIPLKKKLLVENVKIDIGNRQFSKN
jgi:hypothetical protein